MKQKAFKIVLEGSENHVLINKCPASPDDVMSALHFLDDTSVLRVYVVDVEKNENGEFVEV